METFWRAVMVLISVILVAVINLAAGQGGEIKDVRLDKLKIDCQLRTSKEMLQKDKACFDSSAPEDYKKKWLECKAKFGFTQISDLDFLPMWCKEGSNKTQFLMFNDCVSDMEIFNRGDEAEIEKYFKTYHACEDKYFDSKKHYATLGQ